jgi:hypothetical protein
MPTSYWSDHVPSALLALRLTIHRRVGIPPFTIITGAVATPPSYLLEDVPGLPAEATEEEIERYVGWVMGRVSKIRNHVTTKLRARVDISTTSNIIDTLFHFEIGQYVLRRGRAIGKLVPKRDGPFRVTAVKGAFNQRISYVGQQGRELSIHASKLTPFAGPVDEGDWKSSTPAGESSRKRTRRSPRG